MLYAIVFIACFIAGSIAANRVERNVRYAGYDSITFVAFLLVGLFNPMIFDYQSYMDQPDLYVEQADGTVTKPLIGAFHMPFTSETGRRSFRFDSGPHYERSPYTTFVSTHDGETRILEFRMTWQYTIGPERYRELQKTGEIWAILVEGEFWVPGSGLTKQALQLLDTKPLEVKDFLFMVTEGSVYSQEDILCEALVPFLRRHIKMPASLIEVGKPTNCYLEVLE